MKALGRFGIHDRDRRQAYFVHQHRAGWLARSVIPPEPRHLATAERLLSNQPVSTIPATARSVMAITGAASYEQIVRDVFASSTPVHLLAGERSRASWAVPGWAVATATSETLLPGGHLMMVEAPVRFVTAVAGLAGKPRAHRMADSRFRWEARSACLLLALIIRATSSLVELRTPRGRVIETAIADLANQENLDAALEDIPPAEYLHQ